MVLQGGREPCGSSTLWRPRWANRTIAIDPETAARSEDREAPLPLRTILAVLRVEPTEAKIVPRWLGRVLHMPVTVEDVYQTLGLTRREKTRFALVSAIEQGLPATAVERVARLYAPGDRKFLGSLVPPSTLARYKQRRRPLTRDVSDHVVRLTRLWLQAREIWLEEETVRQFLSSPHPLLAGESPMKMAQTSTGARLVEELLGRLEFGSAS